MMNNNMYSSMIFYACIAKGTTILAEFVSKDEDLGAIALKCLEKTPQFHSTYSHTVKNKTYIYLIHNPIVYFGIFDGNLEKPFCVSFLKSMIESFHHILDQNNVKRLDALNTHCFQGEFDPVFHQLLASPLGMDSSDVGKLAVSDEGGSLGLGREKTLGLSPLLGQSGKNVIKKKRRFFGEASGAKKEVLKENKMNVSCDGGVTMSREFTSVANHNKNGLIFSDKAKRVWKKQIWMVLSLDLIVCCIMFAIWLGICQGFKCISD